jgi:ribosome biogenesis GTPase
VSKQRKKKVRVAFRKNRQPRSRSQNLTRRALEDMESVEDLRSDERISGKGELTRRRTIIADESGTSGADGDMPLIQVDEQACLSGRVLFAIGAHSCRVEGTDGRVYECTVRRVVRTLEQETRTPLVAGDKVLFLPTDDAAGVIERREPRSSTLSRGSRGQAHVIAANVDQAVIVSSAAQPPLKPGLIDRFIVSAESGNIRPIICINKMDLAGPDVQPIIDIYAGIGYDVVPCSATRGWEIDRLREMLTGRETVFSGQSGVGKTSLLNAIQSGLGRLTSHVSDDTGKGRHTTRVAELVPLDSGGWVIDTPGIRQFELWDVIPEEVEAYYREFLPFVPDCKFPDCSHTHESGCAVRQAVTNGRISQLRYDNYVRIISGNE